MTLRELKENEELLAACGREVEELARKGENGEAAKIAVCKAHGVEIDEDALNAAAVGKLPVSDAELESVAGGTNWCWGDHYCCYVYSHEGGEGDACFADYECTAVFECSRNITN